MTGHVLKICIEAQFALVLRPKTRLPVPGSTAVLARSPPSKPLSPGSKLASWRVGARPFDALINSLGDFCHLFWPAECKNCVRSAGHTPH